VKPRALLPAVFFGAIAPLVYALLVRLLLTWFVEGRSGVPLAALVYVPPAAALLLLGLGFALSSAAMLGVERWRIVAQLLAWSYPVVAVICCLGFLAAAPSLNPGGLGEAAFVASTGFISVAYAAALAAWFLVLLPAVPVVAAWRGDPHSLWGVLRRHWAGIVARWLLSLLVAGWLTVLLRLILLAAAEPLSTQLLGFSAISWAVQELEERLLPRLVDLVLTPLWLALASTAYARLAAGLLQRR